MLIWINGPFGGGKTQAAYALHRRLPGSVVCDPEEAGLGLHRMTPPRLRRDFQDLPAWRQGVYEVLDLVLSRHEGPVIVPMTVVEPASFQETVGRLRERGHDVRHCTLLAERTTVLRRLERRGLGKLLRVTVGKDAALRRESFAVGKVDRCLERLERPEFAVHIRTDRLTVPQVVESVARSAGITLGPCTGGKLKERLHRAWTEAREIRI